MFFLALLLACSSACAAEPSEKEKIELITRLNAEILSRSHYRQKPLTNALSGAIFEEYFRDLDPGKYFFSAEDLARFAPQKEQLAEKLLAGNADFGFEVYARFRERLAEYRKFAEERMKSGFDFSGNDEMEVDRRNAAWAKDEAALLRLWELRLKNEILTERLFKRAMNDAPVRPGAEENALRETRALWEKNTPEEKIAKRLRDVQNSVDQQNRFDILGTYLTALAQVYGPHSHYASPKLEEDFEIRMKLSLTGIGATLTSDDGFVKIVELVAGGPADRSGKLHPEDRIIAVTQEKGEPADIIDMSVANAVKLIRGPVGSKVTLTILPGARGRQATPEAVTLVREKIELKDSAARGEVREIKDLNGLVRKVGMIELPGFYMDFEAAFRGDPNFRSCSRDVKNILLDFRKQGVDSVVFDLRDNGGGSLQEAISLTGLFITTGPVVQVRQSNRSVKVQSDDDPSVTYSGPLVVLVNKLSASASEIFAGAIKDYQRGVIVGDSRTFGKGTVLDVTPLDRLLRFTGTAAFPAGATTYETAMFYRIAGGSVQQLGVAPDIRLPSLTEEMEIGELFSKNHLPWDSIAPLKTEPYDRSLTLLLPLLRRTSEKRIAESPEYKKLQAKIDHFRKNKERKTLSLNEGKRYQEYKEARKIGAPTEEEEDAEEEKTMAERRRARKSDAVLSEALCIAADYAAVKSTPAAAR